MALVLAAEKVSELYLLEAVAMHQLRHDGFERVRRVELHIREVSHGLQRCP